MLGANINPSLFQTKQGKNMWKKWQQQGDVAHLKRMNTEIKENIKVDPVTQPLRIQSTQAQPKQHVYVAPDKKKTPAAVIHIKPTDVKENFADGKVSGKSRPGRVKRAGASCSGSVTDLRAKAKNASGERARMYHWCANMKSGRNKSK